MEYVIGIESDFKKENGGTESKKYCIFMAMDLSLH